MIYFIQDESGPVKIGWTSDRKRPTERLIGLQAGNPRTLSLLGVVSGTLEDEAQLHAQFEHAHIRGEWFNPVPELLAYIAAHAVMPDKEKAAGFKVRPNGLLWP